MFAFEVEDTRWSAIFYTPVLPDHTSATKLLCPFYHSILGTQYHYLKFAFSWLGDNWTSERKVTWLYNLCLSLVSGTEPGPIFGGGRSGSYLHAEGWVNPGTLASELLIFCFSSCLLLFITRPFSCFYPQEEYFQCLTFVLARGFTCHPCHWLCLCAACSIGCLQWNIWS